MDKHEDTDTEKAQLEKTAERPTPAEPATEELGQRGRGKSSGRPHLRDVTGVTGSYLRAKFDEFLASCKRHKGACIGFGVLAVVAVCCLVAAAVHARNVPDAAFVEKDARTRLAAPEYAPGDFGSSDTLYIRDVHVDSERRVVRTSDSAQAHFGASGYAEAHVTATFGNGSVVATKTATLSYAKVGSEWQAIGGDREVARHVEPDRTAGTGGRRPCRRGQDDRRRRRHRSRRERAQPGADLRELSRDRDRRGV